MKNDLLEKELEKELKVCLKENPTTTITACREIVLEKFKKEGKILGYYTKTEIITNTRTFNNFDAIVKNTITFGSYVGFDNLYYIFINQEDLDFLKKLKARKLK